MITVRAKRSIRLPDYHYIAPGAYLVTLWAHLMRPLFGTIRDGQMHLSRVGRVLDEEWQALPRAFPRLHLDLHVVMPNHFHALFWLVPDIGPGDQPPRQPCLEAPASRLRPRAEAPPAALRLDPGAADPVDTLIGAFRRQVTQRLRRACSGARQPAVWQRDFWEYVVRTEDEVWSFRRHIRDNPRHWASDRYYVAGAEEE